jgi:hypothetical protein
MRAPVVVDGGVVHGVVRDGSTTYCGRPVPEAHLRDLLIGEALLCPSCYQSNNAEPVDDDPAF